MIKIVCEKRQKNFSKIEISGHANSNKKGNDLVCAGVSSIVYGMANALKEYPVEVKITKNKIEFTLLKKNAIAEEILQALYIQLLTIYSEFQDYISIETRKGE